MTNDITAISPTPDTSALKKIAGKAQGDSNLPARGNSENVSGKPPSRISKAKSSLIICYRTAVPWPRSLFRSRVGGGSNDNPKGITMMSRSITMLASAALISAALIGPTFAQGKAQTLSLMKVDPMSLATGYRTSKVVGSTIVNESNETIGTIDDLIVTADEKAPFAVLSVGGFLGMGTKYVVVPYSAFEMNNKADNKMMLRGASADSLKNLPAFKYNN